VLVTGGAGFVGSHVALQLAARGDRVVLLDVIEPGVEAAWLMRDLEGRVEPCIGSVESPDDLRRLCERQKVSHIVHMANIGNANVILENPRVWWRLQPGSTLNVLEVMRELGLNRLIYFSTGGVLARLQYEPIDANHPVILADGGPSGLYGAGKLAGEALCMAYRQHFGIDSVIIRPTSIYGFGMRWPLFVKPMVENSVRGQTTRFDHGSEYPRDYAHVADIAQLVRRALDAPTLRDRIFYGSSGRPLVTAGQLAKAIQQIIPGADIEIGSGLTESERAEILSRGVVDMSPAREQLGFEPRYDDIMLGLEEYVGTYRHYLANGACRSEKLLE
jgi:nucleoside-diphosphate-sugar epimerase